MRLTQVISILALCTVTSLGFARSNLTEGSFLIQATANLLCTNSGASAISGANFDTKFTDSYLGNISLGYQGGAIYLGVRYEDWFAKQTYTLSNSPWVDTLNLQAIGPELGFRWGNPRVQYRLVSGIFYPLTLNVNRAGPTSLVFTQQTLPYYYELRFQTNIKFNSLLSLVLEAGYREVNLGNLTNSGKPFLSNGGDFDLSGPFFGAGFGFHF